MFGNKVQLVVWEATAETIKATQAIEITGSSIRGCECTQTVGFLITQEGHLWQFDPVNHSQLQSLLLPKQVKTVSVTKNAALLVTSQGELFALGQDQVGSGILGLPGPCELLSPQQLLPSVKVKWAFLSEVYAGVLDEQGTVWAWGNGVCDPVSVLTDSRVRQFGYISNKLCTISDSFAVHNSDGTVLTKIEVKLDQVVFMNAGVAGLSAGQLCFIDSEFTLHLFEVDVFIHHISARADTIYGFASAQNRLYEWIVPDREYNEYKVSDLVLDPILTHSGFFTCSTVKADCSVIAQKVYSKQDMYTDLACQLESTLCDVLEQKILQAFHAIADTNTRKVETVQKSPTQVGQLLKEGEISRSEAYLGLCLEKLYLKIMNAAFCRFKRSDGKQAIKVLAFTQRVTQSRLKQLFSQWRSGLRSARIRPLFNIVETGCLRNSYESWKRTTQRTPHFGSPLCQLLSELVKTQLSQSFKRISIHCHGEYKAYVLFKFSSVLLTLHNRLKYASSSQFFTGLSEYKPNSSLTTIQAETPKKSKKPKKVKQVKKKPKLSRYWVPTTIAAEFQPVAPRPNEPATRLAYEQTRIRKRQREAEIQALVQKLCAQGYAPLKNPNSLIKLPVRQRLGLGLLLRFVSNSFLAEPFACLQGSNERE